MPVTFTELGVNNMATNENINIGAAIELYVTARDKKAEMEARHTAELEPVLEALEEAKALVIGYMVTNKQDGIRTEHGMASLGITDKVYVQDRTALYRDWETDRKSTRLNSSHRSLSRMPSSA